MDLLSGLQTLFGAKPAPARSDSDQKHSALHHRETELKKKNIMLQEQLDAANERIIQLENQIRAMEKENTKVEQNTEAKRDEIDQLIVGVTVQVQNMMESLDQQMKQLEVKTDRQIRQLTESTQKQIGELKDTTDQIRNISDTVQPIREIQNSTEEIRESVSRMDEIKASTDRIGEIQQSVSQIDELRSMVTALGQQRISMDEVNEKAESLKTDIVGRVHAENVQCYRNMKGLVTDLDVKIEELELDDNSLKKIQKSFKGMKFFTCCGFLGFLLVIFLTLYTMGIITF